MAVQDSVDYDSAVRAMQNALTELAQRADMGVIGFIAFRRAWIRELGRLAREHQEDWVTSAYAVQTIRQLRGQLPIQ